MENFFCRLRDRQHMRAQILSHRLSFKANRSLQKSFFLVFLSPKGFSPLLLPTTLETKCLPYRRIQGSCLFHLTSAHLTTKSTAFCPLLRVLGSSLTPRPLCSSIPHISDCDNETPDAVISAHHFPGHKRCKLGYFPARQACWAVGRAEIRCWKTEERTREEHVKERSKDACNLNNLNSQQFQSLLTFFISTPPP